MLRHRRLVWDLILVILDHVVCSAPVTQTKKNKTLVKRALWRLTLTRILTTFEVFHSGTDLLLRKQFWITLMMKDAASFSLKPGLNRCLNVGEEATKNITFKLVTGVGRHVQVDLYSLQQFDGLSSEAREASV